jgi:leader peptidase (prepilin peptidase)/N-methyltransferase
MALLLDYVAFTLVLALGCAIGSFLNVVVYRLPAGLSLLYPPSRCPHCLHPLGKTENVPVLGWFWLRGRCRWCRAAISPRYPLVEALTGSLFMLIFWHYGWTWQTPGYWLLASLLVVLTLIDWDTMTLPGILTKSGLVLGFLFQTSWGWFQGQGLNGFWQALLGALLGLWLFDGIRVGGTLCLHQEAMGDGDPKLAAMLGAWLGWPLLLVASLLACGAGTLAGGLALAGGWLKRRQGFPFGPFLALGGLGSLLWGEALLTFYLQTFLPQF